MTASHTTHNGHKSDAHMAPDASQKRLSDQEYLKRHRDRMSRTAQRAKWISSLDEHEDHPGQTLVTRSHEVIRHWAEERDAVPSTVGGTARGDLSGVLRFNFPGYGGQRLEEIDWDQFFKTFDARDLVFLYQERMRAGNQSNFFHFDRPEDEATTSASPGSHATHDARDTHRAGSHTATHTDSAKEKRSSGGSSHDDHKKR